MHRYTDVPFRPMGLFRRRKSRLRAWTNLRKMRISDPRAVPTRVAGWLIVHGNSVTISEHGGKVEGSLASNG